MRCCAAVVAVLLVLLFTRTAAADPAIGGMFGVGLTVMQPNLTSTRFGGVGTSGGGSASFDSAGRDFGLRHPVLIGGELRVGVLGHYFEIGAQFLYSGVVTAPDTAADDHAVQLVDATALSAIGGGVHAEVAIPVSIDRMLVTFVAGPDIGLRSFSVPLTGFDPTACEARAAARSPDACRESASSGTDPYFQPRIGVIIQEHQRRGYGFFLKPWFGVDVYPEVTWAAGITVGVASEHANL